MAFKIDESIWNKISQVLRIIVGGSHSSSQVLSCSAPEKILCQSWELYIPWTCSEGPATSSYTPNVSSLHCPIYNFKIISSIIIPPTPRSSKIPT